MAKASAWASYDLAFLCCEHEEAPDQSWMLVMNTGYP